MTKSNNLNRYLSVKRWQVKNKKLFGMPIISAMIKYGIENFDVDILATTNSLSALANLEKLWIILLNARSQEYGYNVCMGGLNSRTGVKTSQETKDKIGLANKGRKPKGYIRTPEHKEQIRLRMLGNKRGKGRGFGHFVSDSEKEKHKASAIKQWRENPPKKERVAIF